MKKRFQLFFSLLLICISPLISQGQCSASYVLAVTGCTNSDILVTDNSILSGPSGPITKILWIWGDGKVDTVTNNFGTPRSHHYSAGGQSYVVTETILTQNGCTSSYTMFFIFARKPRFGISNTSCINGAVTITDSAYIQQSSIDSITKEIWNWGDGKIDTILGPVITHNYFTNGNFTIKQTVFTKNGCTQTDSQTINVKIKPQVAFTVGEQERFCGYTNVAFTNNSAISTGDSLSLLWRFSDNNTTSAAGFVKKEYTQSGTYLAKLVVTAQNGCSDSLSKNVNIYAIIGAAFKVEKKNICLSDTAVVTLTYQGSTTGSSFLRRIWNFGDGTIFSDNSGNSSFPHKYSNPGKYTITLTYQTTTCTLYYTDSIQVGVAPQAAFSTTPDALNICGSQKINFTNLSSSPFSSSLNYHWYSNNSLVSSLANPSITYYANGDFPITLRAIDAGTGCYGQIDGIVNVTGVNPKPKSNFAFETDPGNLLKIKFYDSSSINAPGVINNYSWDFGDGSAVLNTANKDTSHLYPNRGIFIIKHIVSSNLGCADTLTKSITVDSAVISLCNPRFGGISSACIGSPYTISDSSVAANASDTLVRQIWNYGDGIIDTIYTGFAPTRTHIYQNTGTYNITLSILTKRGCTNSYTKPVLARSNNVKSKFSYTQAPNCLSTNQTIQFTNETEYVGTLSNRWLFGDADIETSVLAPAHVYPPGNYTVKYLTKISACMQNYDTLVKQITVLPISKAGMYYKINEIKAKTINFFDNSIKGINLITGYVWDFGDGSSSTETNPEHTYSNYGTYTIKHSFITADCVPDTILYTVKIDSFVTLSSAISQSNMGTDFWAGYGYIQNMARLATNTSRPFLSIYLSAGNNPATVLVDLPNMAIAKKAGTGFPKVVYVPANSVVEVSGFPIGDPYDVYNANNFADSRLYFTGITDRGIRITSNQPIGAWEHVYSTNNTAGGTLLLPTKMWSTSYIVQSMGGKANSNNPNSYFFVIAESDSTTIEFTPSNDIIDSSAATIFTEGHMPANVLYKAGVTYSKLLNKGEIFNAMGMIQGSGQNVATALDLSGTKIISTNPLKKIAVFGGNGRVIINTIGCVNTTGSDNLIQQMFPKAVWGTKYLTAPTKTMETNNYRITVDDPTTVVTVNGALLTSLINNRYYEISRNQTLKIESNKRIMVTQYIVTPGCPTYTSGNNGAGDPELINLTPVKYGVKNATVYSPPFKTTSVGASASYLNVILKKEGLNSLLIDNSNMIDTGTSSYVNGAAYGSSALITIPNASKAHSGDTNYVYVRVKVATGATHTLQCDSSFLAIAYGMGNGETIGYNVGFNFNTLPVTYQYLGTGDWTNSINWLGNKIPPNPLPMGSEIIISGICTLNTPQVIEDGARLVVESGGKLIVNQNLIIQQ